MNRKKYLFLICLLTIAAAFSGCSQKKTGNITGESTTAAVKTDADVTGENASEEVISLLKKGTFSDPITLSGSDRDEESLIQKDQRILFPQCSISSVLGYMDTTESNFIDMKKEEILQLVGLIESTKTLEDGKSLKDYGINENTGEYAYLEIVFLNSRGEYQNLSVSTDRGNVVFLEGYFDQNKEEITTVRLEPNEELTQLIKKYAGYRVLKNSDFDKIDRIVVNQVYGDSAYDGKEYEISSENIKRIIKKMKKLNRMDELGSTQVDATAYTSDGDTYHFKVGMDSMGVEGAAYESSEELLNLFLK